MVGEEIGIPLHKNLFFVLIAHLLSHAMMCYMQTAAPLPHTEVSVLRLHDGHIKIDCPISLKSVL